MKWDSLTEGIGMGLLLILGLLVLVVGGGALAALLFTNKKGSDN